MGVRSTYEITREAAIQALLSNIFTMTDEQLASALECLPDQEFRNYSVVTLEQIEVERKKKYRSPTITNLEEFKFTIR